VTTLPIESAPPEAPARATSGGRPAGVKSSRWRIPLLIARRLIGALLSLVAIVLFNFFLFRVLSTNPIRSLVRNRHLDAAAQAQLKHEFGFDKSKWAQFVDYVDQLFLHHNLGISTYYTQPVWSVIVGRIWPTVLLVGVSTILSSVLGTWLGIKGAWDRGSRFDKISNGISVTLYSVPEFWLGLVILLFLAGDTVGLGWFPLGGIYDDNVDPASVSGWINIAWHLVLPGLTLTLAYLAQYQLVMRSSMLDEMGQDYVLTARAKGLRDLAVRRHHVVPNALLPAVTQIFLYFGFVISGALLVETVFSWPGLGLLTEQAVSSADFPLLEGLFLLFTASVIVFNLIADVMLGILDPRVREL
jgi:peptide/nickel transport system permease protein